MNRQLSGMGPVERDLREAQAVERDYQRSRRLKTLREKQAARTFEHEHPFQERSRSLVRGAENQAQKTYQGITKGLARPGRGRLRSIVTGLRAVRGTIQGGPEPTGLSSITREVVEDYIDHFQRSYLRDANPNDRDFFGNNNQPQERDFLGASKRDVKELI
jgi:hypothetical protein